MSSIPLSESQMELDAVVLTAQLRQRPRRPQNHAAEHRALSLLAQMLANPPRDILQRLADAALQLCQAGSAGISIIENHLGEQVFRWHALAGSLASHKWDTLPRDFSPCGIVIDRNATQLMHLPERHFLYLANVTPQVVEVLLVPFSVHGQAVGTIWVVAHDDARKFDAEDERLVKELGRFATGAYQLASSVAASKISDRRKHEFLATIARELRRPLSASVSLMPHRRGYAVGKKRRYTEPAIESDESRMISMKRAFNGVLERLRIRFETISNSTASNIDGPCPPDKVAPSSSGQIPLSHDPDVSIVSPIHAPFSRGLTRHGRHIPLADSSYGTPSSAADSGSLINRMRCGDQNAFEELYDSTVGSVYAFALAILKSAEDAEEVVCDTYTRAWLQSGRFDAERASPMGWLMMMCRGRAIDRLRQNRCRGSAKKVSIDFVGEPTDGAVPPEDLLSLFHNGSRVQEALATLSPERLTLVELAFFEGLTFAEMAARTGTPIGTVKSHVRRALAALRRKLEGRESQSMNRGRRNKAASGSQ